jgi:uncharacterized repeat protein (TIGR03803 family)
MLINFVGANYGDFPETLVRDASGNLYSTVFSPISTACGKNSCGQVIKLTPDASGHYNESIVHRFVGGATGYEPISLLIDAKGDLFGTTDAGGIVGAGCASGCGAIYELKPLAGGGYAFSVIYSFTDSKDGNFPSVNLIDASGNLYGVASGGPHGHGQIFRLTNSGGTWAKTILYNFANTTADVVGSPMFMDAAGNMFLLAVIGGNVNTQCPSGCGEVFELSPSSSTWTRTLLYAFNGLPDGDDPITLVPDGAGNIWGTTYFGGSVTQTNCQSSGCGTLFELTPNSSGTWTETIQHTFNWTLDGGYPQSFRTDGAGNFYVGMYGGGVGGFGAVLKFALGSDGIWEYTTLHGFADGLGGAGPFALVLDSTGDIYGALIAGGTKQLGGFFELSPPAVERQ